MQQFEGEGRKIKIHEVERIFRIVNETLTLGGGSRGEMQN